MIIWARPMFSALLALSMWLVHCLSCVVFYGHLRSFFWSKRYLALLLLTWLLVCSPVSPAGGRLFLDSQTHQGPCQLLLLVLSCCCPCSKPGTTSPIPSLPYSRSWSPCPFLLGLVPSLPEAYVFLILFLDPRNCEIDIISGKKN